MSRTFQVTPGGASGSWKLKVSMPGLERLGQGDPLAVSEQTSESWGQRKDVAEPSESMVPGALRRVRRSTC